MEMKSLSEIAVGLITHIHDTLPEVDTKEGTFIRDVFIDPVSTQLADLYQEIKLVELAQSIVTAEGEDLDKLARNFFIRRKDATYSSGTLRFFLGLTEPEEDIYLPRGAILATEGDSDVESLDFITSETVTVVAGDSNSYKKDDVTGMYYVDVEAMSLDPGEQYNTEADTVVLLGDIVDSGIESVTNPFPFTGGSDEETDLSLQFRVSMAITGVNIGTKDGYTSFIMKQSEVVDAAVVGAGEPLMLRDNGEGGMVDIHVRAQTIEEHVFEFDVDYDYTTNTANGPAYENIILPNQPIISVNSIIGRTPNLAGTGYDERSYINGSSYSIEKGSDRYYRDTKWSFTELLTDELIGDNLLKVNATNLISEMLQAVDFMQDTKYDIDWQLINPYNDYATPENENFYRGYFSDGAIYMITTRVNSDNPFIGGRNFVIKNGEFYERAYVEPDFIIEKDTTEYSRSISAKDSIKWISNSVGDNLPKEGETLYVTYSYNSVISSLQSRLEEKRILTADVLIRQAIEVPIEIKINVVPEVGYTESTIRSTIVNNITSYIDDVKKLGGAIDRSDLVYIARGAEGVEAVDITNIHLSVLDGAPIQKIELKNLEYMKIASLYINILPSGTVV